MTKMTQITVPIIKDVVFGYLKKNRFCPKVRIIQNSFFLSIKGQKVGITHKISLSSAN